MSRVKEQNKKIRDVLSNAQDPSVQIDEVAKIRGWHRPRDDSAYYSVVQDYLDQKIDLDEASSRILKPIDEKIVASKLDDVNFLDLWNSIIHSGRRISLYHIYKRDQVADLIDLVGAFKTHSIPDNAEYDYLYSALTDFDLACREAFNDAPVAHDGFFKIEADAWANLNFFYARTTEKEHHDFSLYAIWAMRQALETTPQDDNEATSAQKLDAYVPAAAAWVMGSGRILFMKEKDLTPTDRKQGDPARGGELWKGKSEFSRNRWSFWKERFAEIGRMSDVSESTRTTAKTAVEEMERSETFERV